MSIKFRFIQPEAVLGTHVPGTKTARILQYRLQGIGYQWETVPLEIVPDDEYEKAVGKLSFVTTPKEPTP